MWISIKKMDCYTPNVKIQLKNWCCVEGSRVMSYRPWMRTLKAEMWSVLKELMHLSSVTLSSSNDVAISYICDTTLVFCIYVYLVKYIVHIGAFVKLCWFRCCNMFRLEPKQCITRQILNQLGNHMNTNRTVWGNMPFIPSVFYLGSSMKGFLTPSMLRFQSRGQDKCC